MDFIDKLNHLISENDLYNLKSYVSLNNIQVNTYNESCYDLLIQSIEKNASESILKYILSFYKNVNFEIINGKIPLFIAIEMNHFNQANLLLKYNANINYINKNKDNIITYLMNKNLLTKKKLIYILKKNININFKNRQGVRIVDSLIRKKDFELVNCIFKTLIYQKDTVLRLINTYKYGIPMSKKQLLDFIEEEKSKIEITKPMFIIAIKNTDEAILNLLLEHEINDYIFDVNNGYNLLIEAAERSNYPIVKLLIKKV